MGLIFSAWGRKEGDFFFRVWEIYWWLLFFYYFEKVFVEVGLVDNSLFGKGCLDFFFLFLENLVIFMYDSLVGKEYRVKRDVGVGCRGSILVI